MGLENGKLAWMNIGNWDKKELKERESFKAILTNIPWTAHEILLLRDFQFTEAKTIYILFNLNRNSSHIAKIFFKTKEDMKRATSRSIYYYNTKLFWKKSLTYIWRKDEKKSFEKDRSLNWQKSQGNPNSIRTKRRDSAIEETGVRTIHKKKAIKGLKRTKKKEVDLNESSNSIFRTKFL